MATRIADEGLVSEGVEGVVAGSAAQLPMTGKFGQAH